MHLPHSLIVGQDGRIYVCDRENSRIQIFSAEGEYIEMWTDMHRPLDISQDPDGVFYITERAEDGSPPQVSVLGQDGQVLARFASRSGPRVMGRRSRRHILGADRRGKHRQVRAPRLSPVDIPPVIPAQAGIHRLGPSTSGCQQNQSVFEIVSSTSHRQEM